MPNNYLSVLYKHIIQVENTNVGLKVGGRKHTIAPPPPPTPLPTPITFCPTCSQLMSFVLPSGIPPIPKLKENVFLTLKGTKRGSAVVLSSSPFKKHLLEQQKANTANKGRYV